VEFDGANSENLVPATNGGIFSTNNEHLFSFISRPEGVFLQDSKMIIN
jgi:hypothetical protein